MHPSDHTPSIMIPLPFKNQQSERWMVYKFQCNLCDADYVGYTTQHLHQDISKHKHLAIGKRIEEHGVTKSALEDENLLLNFEEMQIKV